MINSLLRDAKEILKSKRLDYFGELLHESWMAKRSLSNKVSNNKIDDLYNFALNSGAEGGKLLGAEGGFFVFYVKRNNHKKFINKMKKTLIYLFNLMKQEVILL